jgi:hypothetical protein
MSETSSAVAPTAAAVVGSNGLTRTIPQPSVPEEVKSIGSRIAEALAKDKQFCEDVHNLIALRNKERLLDVVDRRLACAIATLTVKVAFGSHRDARHCTPCRELMTSASRAVMVASQLRGAIQHNTKLATGQRMYVLVGELDAATFAYIMAFQAPEVTEKKAENDENMLTAASCLSEWAANACKFMLDVCYKIVAENDIDNKDGK